MRHPAVPDTPPAAGFWDKLRSRFNELTGTACRAEISGARRIVLQGCRRILTYEADCIRFTVSDSHAKTVTVRGRRLSCLSYHTDAVVIEGEITAVLFSEATDADVSAP